MPAIADATESTVEQLAKAVSSLQETVEQLKEENQELREELAEHKDHTGREFADVRGRITDVEEDDSPDETTGIDTEKEESKNTEIPLERICVLPEHVAARELTANQERARFIAMGVHDYAEKVPAGLVVDSRAIKRYIAAAEEKRPHTQTVARVMDFLNELGKDAVELIKRRGRKLVVFDRAVVDRLANHSRCDGGSGPTAGKGVIGPA